MPHSNHKPATPFQCKLEIIWIQELIGSPFWTELNPNQRQQWLQKLADLNAQGLKN